MLSGGAWRRQTAAPAELTEHPDNAFIRNSRLSDIEAPDQVGDIRAALQLLQDLRQEILG